jgi:hypothetical protein
VHESRIIANGFRDAQSKCGAQHYAPEAEKNRAKCGAQHYAPEAEKLNCRQARGGRWQIVLLIKTGEKQEAFHGN